VAKRSDRHFDSHQFLIFLSPLLTIISSHFAPNQNPAFLASCDTLKSKYARRAQNSDFGRAAAPFSSTPSRSTAKTTKITKRTWIPLSILQSIRYSAIYWLHYPASEPINCFTLQYLLAIKALRETPPQSKTAHFAPRPTYNHINL
jgi:hypothetical protein